MVLQVEQIESFRHYLKEEEKSESTIEKYIRDIGQLYQFAGAQEEINKSLILSFKEQLQKAYKGTSVNSMLAAVNRFLGYLGLNECRVKQLKIQRQTFCAEEKELSKAEYIRLVEAANKCKNERLSLVMQTICATGIRVSEIQYITVEALQDGTAEVRCKGKTRVVMIPGKLQKILKQYVKRQEITSGQVFVTKSGKPLNRSNIWSDMKLLCKAANVEPKKVFPHNFRHLFAKTFYNLKKDLVKLADVLGHSQIETTRIYTISTGQEHKKQINALNLVL